MRLFNFFAIMFLLVGALAFSSCTDTETVTETVTDTVTETVTDTVTETVTDTEYVCADGTTADSAAECPDIYDEIGPGYEVTGMECYEDGDRDGMIAGTDMGDCIMGQGGNDSIKGMGGNDNLNGGPGNDTLYGGPGNDDLTGGSGDNTLDGGEGTDIAVYKDAMMVEVQLSNNVAGVRHAVAEAGSLLAPGDSGTGRDTLISIENVKGTLLGADTITGDENANVLKGLDQADTLNGGAGDDTILPNRPAEDGAANIASGTEPEIDGIDVVDGGEGSDTISYEGESGVVTINLSATGDPGFIAAVTDDPGTTDDETDFAHFQAIVTGAATDEIKVVDRGTADEPKLESTIENVMGGFGGDTLTGDARSNTLSGGAGDDTLNGEANPAAAETMGAGDTLNGGVGNDELNGGPGDDTLNGNAGNDALNGNAGNDVLDGGAGNDTLEGGAGNDTYIVSKGDGGDTISTFVAGDRIVLKGFGGSGNVKLNMTTGGVLQDVDPDDSTDVTTLVTITTGFGLVRLTTDIHYVD